MRRADYAILLAVVCVALGICAAMFLRPSEAEAVGRPEFLGEPSEASYSAPVQPEPEQAHEPEPEADETPAETLEAVESQDGYAPDPYVEYGISYDGHDAAYNDNGPSREMPGWHDGRKETYYSSNVLHHYRTDEWTVDEDGFYRTDEGYYVVGVTLGDYELGDTFEGGRGTCYVADFGYADEPITDYYTNW